MIIAFYSYGY